MLDTLNYYWDRFVDFYIHIRQYVLLPLEFKEFSVSFLLINCWVFMGMHIYTLWAVSYHRYNPAPIILLCSTLIYFLVQLIYWKLLSIYQDMNLHDFRKGKNVPELLRAILHGVACLTFPMMLSSLIFSILPHT